MTRYVIDPQRRRVDLYAPVGGRYSFLTFEEVVQHLAAPSIWSADHLLLLRVVRDDLEERGLLPEAPP